MFDNWKVTMPRFPLAIRFNFVYIHKQDHNHKHSLTQIGTYYLLSKSNSCVRFNNLKSLVIPSEWMITLCKGESKYELLLIWLFQFLKIAKKCSNLQTISFSIMCTGLSIPAMDTQWRGQHRQLWLRTRSRAHSFNNINFKIFFLLKIHLSF